MDRRQVAVLLVLAAQLVAGPALADSQVLHETCTWLSDLAQWLVGIGFVCGTIGLAFVGMKASATGRFSGGGFVSIMGGMFLLGALPSVISYMIDGTFSWTC